MVTWDEAERIFQKADPKFKAWSQPQRDAYLQWGASLKRQLLFFPTGKGKTKTALALIASRGHKRVVVIAPPKTHPDWKKDAALLGLDIRIESVNKFRMANTFYSKTLDVAWIVDEYHQLGGHTGVGFKKFNKLMRTFTGDLIMASATPNYNDADRVFCLTAIGDEAPNRNFLDWVWDNCICKPNHFSTIPDVF